MGVRVAGWAVAALACASMVAAQTAAWQIQASGMTAGLRGIDAVNARVAWASGTGGTVLRTTDGGGHWQKCAVPDADKDGASLDFRGVQAWDAETAVVMASGPGAKSGLYRTEDGCSTWRLVFANPDAPGGFFDSFWFNGQHGIVVGDPVRGKMVVFLSLDRGKSWKRDEHGGLAVKEGETAAFAASNSAIPVGNGLFARAFATGGKGGAVFFSRPFTAEEEKHGIVDKLVRKEPGWRTSKMPLKGGADSAGAFSVAYRFPVTIGSCGDCNFGENSLFVAVGGDYTKPNETAGTAAWSADGGWTWTAAVKPLHGFRSAVQWSADLKVWIAAGTNGSDWSRDDGRTWTALDDGNWNALSLPFAVGPGGRIGRLNAQTLTGNSGQAR
ncbi:MAG: glycosyl hydrolase [Terracidiphilus sp.]|nr:glycosyl hydrolase [Terracidiphilus sp.]